METVTIVVNGHRLEVPVGSSVAAALLGAGITFFRPSLTGEPRAPLCGMGICFECCVTIDDIPYVRSCQERCRNGMRVVTEN